MSNNPYRTDAEDAEDRELCELYGKLAKDLEDGKLMEYQDASKQWVAWQPKDALDIFHHVVVRRNKNLRSRNKSIIERVTRAYQELVK